MTVTIDAELATQAPVVTTVEVTPASPTVALGDRSNDGSETFTATVKDADGNPMSSQTINWTLTGANEADTALDTTTGASVTLTVSKNETAGTSVKLKATCEGVDSDEITVTITADS